MTTKKKPLPTFGERLKGCQDLRSLFHEIQCARIGLNLQTESEDFLADIASDLFAQFFTTAAPESYWEYKKCFEQLDDGSREFAFAYSHQSITAREMVLKAITKLEQSDWCDRDELAWLRQSAVYFADPVTVDDVRSLSEGFQNLGLVYLLDTYRLHTHHERPPGSLRMEAKQIEEWIEIFILPGAPDTAAVLADPAIHSAEDLIQWMAHHKPHHNLRP
jgi:hypothetical protein